MTTTYTTIAMSLPIVLRRIIPQLLAAYLKRHGHPDTHLTHTTDPDGTRWVEVTYQDTP